MVSQEPVPHEPSKPFGRADPKVARETIESFYPAAEARADLLSLFADSIETAHGVNPAGWSVTLGLRGHRVNLNAGKIYAVSLRADLVGVSLRFRPDELSAPWAEEVRLSVRQTFRAVPGVRWCGFPPDRLLELWESLRPLHLAAVEEAAGGVRRTPYYRSHSPGVLQYVARVAGRTLPSPEHGEDQGQGGGLTGRIVSLVRRRFPDWDSVEHPGFTEEEITYKREAAVLAEELLGESQLRELIEEARFDDVVARVKKVAQKTNLLYLGAPSSGDLAALHADGLDREAFSHALVDLLYGDGDSPLRLQCFTEFLERRELPNKWTLPTYLLFLRFPQTEYLVKPSVTRWFLKEAGVAELYDPRPDGETYGRILEHVRDLAAELEPYGARDLIDVQSALWVAHAHAREEEDIHPGEAKLQEMDSLFAEFVRDHLADPAGREHMSRYDEVREAGRRSYQEIVAARDAGEDVTDRVLRELLPHTDSEAHRDEGAWIHVAPAILGNVKSFFEAAGWRQPGDWEEVARAVLDFVERCHGKPLELERACIEFSKQPWSIGLQTGMLTPILNALRPEEFLLLNNKSRQLINYLSGRSLSQKLVDYPDLNRIGRILIEILSDQLDSAPIEAQTDDVFDAFSHWLVSIRRFPFGKPQYWKIAPGEGARYWRDSLEGDFISIGWNDLGDLSNVSREGFEERRDRLIKKDGSLTKEALEQVWKFAKEIGEGDRIVANQGTRRVLGFGMVTGAYHYVADADHSHRLPVDWDDITPRVVEQGGWRRAVVSLDRDLYKKLVIAPIDDGDSMKPPPLNPKLNEPFSLDDCASELHLPPPTLRRWVRAIERKGQAILYGPPGTGKTYVAEHLARHLIGGGDGFTELVQFHPSFSYEDFIQGLRPEALADGGLSYPVKRGRFLDFCAEARQREGTCVLIVDEINRANLSRVFGELMYLLEYREDSVRLAADGRSFSIPGNVLILGTMNTADRSIALVDHALRRRFAFLALRPSYDALRRHHEGRGDEVRDLVEPLVDLLKEVNSAIGDPHYELGITYFLVDDLPGLLEDVWRMEVEPYLEEYFYDQPEKTERFRWSAVRGRLTP